MEESPKTVAFKILWKSGFNAQFIADALGYSTSHSVMANAVRLGLGRRKWKDSPSYYKSILRSDEIQDMWFAGISAQNIAFEIGVSHGTICNVLDDLKLAKTEGRVCTRCDRSYTTHPQDSKTLCKRCRKLTTKESVGRYDAFNRGGVAYE